MEVNVHNTFSCISTNPKYMVDANSAKISSVGWTLEMGIDIYLVKIFFFCLKKDTELNISTKSLHTTKDCLYKVSSCMYSFSYN